MKRRRILHADKIIQNIIHIFCLIMILQLKGYCSNPSPVLLYSTATDIRLVNASKTSKINSIIEGLEQGSAVDFLYRSDLLCWSDQTAELIQCIKYNETFIGEKMKIVSEGVITPTGIAVDWFTEKIYWTDGETNKIEVISIHEKYRKVLFWSEVDLARAIALDPSEGLMFWTDWGDVPKIEKAGMNGDHATRKVIVKDDIFWPNGITIDYSKKIVFWVDAKLRFVDSINYNGEKRKRIIKKGLDYPYAITFFFDKLYWTDWKTWAIYSFDISTNGPVKDLIKSKQVPVDLKIFDSTKQVTPNHDYPCKANNGGCSHLCLLAPYPPGFVCSCPTGVKLKENSTSLCYNGPQSMLLVAQRATILKISLDSPDFTPNVLSLKDVKRAIDVDFDPRTEFVYWADSVSKTISRSRLDGTEQAVVVHNNGVPGRIAIDPLARNMYWTDPLADTITVARLDGTARKVIIHDNLDEPRAIALHPVGGLMFWSDWSDKSPKIERANLDGSSRTILVLERVTWPNGIALDVAQSKVYWGDARTHKIEVINMDGTDRKVLYSNDIPHIFGLTLLGDHLYWTDMQRRSLDRIDKNTGTDRKSIVEQMANNLMGVRAIKLGEATGWNQCADDNGGCSHFCFNTPEKYICSCPLSYELGEDRKTCIEPEAFLVYGRKNIIGRISIEHENNDAVFPLRDLREVSALALYPAEALFSIYWSDSKTKTISRCSINGSNMEKIVEWIGVVEGLAIDSSAQNIYWTDMSSHRIEVARLDGSNRRTLIWQGLKKPKSIALDPKKGYMYWSELGSKSIKRAGMDGSNPTVIIEQTGRVHAMAIDHEAHGIYWAALDPPTIEFAFFNGTGRKILVENVPVPYALDVFRDKVFWGDWNTGIVECANKSNGSSRKTVHTHLDYITDLKIYNRHDSHDDNQCSVGNGGCSHLCLPVPSTSSQGDYRCACPTHYTLNKDNLTCSEPQEFVLFSQRNAVGRIVASGSECSDAFIPLTGLKNVRTVDYDPVNKHLYWIEEDYHAIRRVPVSDSATSASSSSTTIVEGLSKPFDLVLDVLGRTLYWTCVDTDSINATTVDTNSSTGVILKEDNMMPRHLAFHQTKRLLIWNDVGRGAIMRSSVDGTSRVELVKTGNVTALTVDQTSSTVYYALSRQIHAVDLDTEHRRMVWGGAWAGSVAALGGALYVCGGAMLRLQLARRDVTPAPIAHAPKARVLRAIVQVSRSHPCWRGGACGEQAAACGAGGACGCGVSCADSRAGCPPRHVACVGTHDRHVCIPDHWRCDGQADCADGWDEMGCGACEAGIRCADGQCAEHCDAAPCRVSPLAFRCDEDLCLSPRLLCDGEQHCEDGSDESPENCDYDKQQQTTTSSGGGSGSILGMSCGLVGGVLAAGAAWAARRWRQSPRDPHQMPPEPGRLLHPRKTVQPRSLPSRGRHMPTTRVDPLGASYTASSSSGCERYPLPLVNPPPSPATASGGGGASACGGTTGRGYRHYRMMNRPPPPTPASTDACESDPEPPPPSPDTLYSTDATQ